MCTADQGHTLKHALTCTVHTLHSQSSSASPVKEKTPASGTFPTYQKPSTIIHTPHPTTGVIYSDINVERKKRMKIQTAVEEVGAGPMHVPDTCIYMSGTCIYLWLYILLLTYNMYIFRNVGPHC